MHSFHLCLEEALHPAIMGWIIAHALLFACRAEPSRTGGVGATGHVGAITRGESRIDLVNVGSDDLNAKHVFGRDDS